VGQGPGHLLLQHSRSGALPACVHLLFGVVSGGALIASLRASLASTAFASNLHPPLPIATDSHKIADAISHAAIFVYITSAVVEI
jgi:hypothetical protein